MARPDIWIVSESNDSPKSRTRSRFKDAGSPHVNNDPKVVNLAYYRIKKSLQQEGFDLVTDADGKLTLVLRVTK